MARKNKQIKSANKKSMQSTTRKNTQGRTKKPVRSNSKNAKKDYPSLNLRINGKKVSASRIKDGIRYNGIRYKGSVTKKGNDINVNLKKKGFFETMFG